MNKAIWILAILIDALGVVLGCTYFLANEVLVWAWGVATIVIFGSLLILLIRPQVFGERTHPATAAKILCWSVPIAAFVGSLDSGVISGLEWLAIIGYGLVGGLNWLAFRGRVPHLPAEAV